MNGIVKTAQRFIHTAKHVALAGATTRGPPSHRAFTRGIWHMSCTQRMAGAGLLRRHSEACSCGCGLKALHTKGKLFVTFFLGYVTYLYLNNLVSFILNDN